MYNASLIIKDENRACMIKMVSLKKTAFDYVFYWPIADINLQTTSLKCFIGFMQTDKLT